MKSAHTPKHTHLGFSNRSIVIRRVWDEAALLHVAMWAEFLNTVILYIPDWILRWGVYIMLWGRLREHTTKNCEAQAETRSKFVADLKKDKIAIKTGEANQQHYEVPTPFYQLCLGARLKYSCCLFDKKGMSLDQAEEAMLNKYCERAQIEDGMTILDLGCGWGSLCLFLCEKFPNAKIRALSNSNTQREFIMERARTRGFNNLKVYTGDVAEFDFQGKEDGFDRVVSVEMFEHMKNYGQLLKKISTWLKPEGKLFVHIFAHRDYGYHFEGDSWMAKYFFSGGTMPSDDLLLRFQEHLTVEETWRVNGKHYAQTCRKWLQKLDSNRKGALHLFEETYPKGTSKQWLAMWRVFYVACEELFAFNGGNEWFVSHYRFIKKGYSDDE